MNIVDFMMAHPFISLFMVMSITSIIPRTIRAWRGTPEKPWLSINNKE